MLKSVTNILVLKKIFNCKWKRSHSSSFKCKHFLTLISVEFNYFQKNASTVQWNDMFCHCFSSCICLIKVRQPKKICFKNWLLCEILATSKVIKIQQSAFLKKCIHNKYHAKKAQLVMYCIFSCMIYNAQYIGLYYTFHMTNERAND